MTLFSITALSIDNRDVQLFDETQQAETDMGSPNYAVRPVFVDIVSLYINRKSVVPKKDTYCIISSVLMDIVPFPM